MDYDSDEPMRVQMEDVTVPPEVRRTFTTMEIEEFKQVFALYQSEETSTIEIETIPSILVSIGFEYDMDNLDDIIKQVVPEEATTVELNDFLTITSRSHLPETIIKERILTAFEMISPESHILKVGDLRYFLTKFGEVLNEEEMKQLLKFIPEYGDSLDYELFVKTLAPLISVGLIQERKNAEEMAKLRERGIESSDEDFMTDSS